MVNLNHSTAFLILKMPFHVPLKEQGYHTELLTTGDLAFGKTGKWAKNIGFDYLEGHKHPFYKKWPRFKFRAAADEALYHRINDRIRVNSKKGDPYFIFIKTVNHPWSIL